MRHSTAARTYIEELVDSMRLEVFVDALDVRVVFWGEAKLLQLIHDLSLLLVLL